jgi:hypothetical protein
MTSKKRNEKIFFGDYKPNMALSINQASYSKIRAAGGLNRENICRFGGYSTDIYTRKCPTFEVLSLLGCETVDIRWRVMTLQIAPINQVKEPLPVPSFQQKIAVQSKEKSEEMLHLGQSFVWR